MTHVSKVSVQDLHVTVDDLECDELVVGRADPADEEQRGVSPVDDLCVCGPCVTVGQSHRDSM